MSRQTAYFPLKKQADDLNFTIAAFDFETEGLGGKLLCATWYIDGMMEPEIILGDPDEIADAIIRIFEISGKSVRWYAHNAQYDWRYIVDKLVDSKTAEKLDKTETSIQIIKLLIPTLTPAEIEDIKSIVDFIIQNNLIKLPSQLTKQLNVVKTSFFSKK